MKYLLEPLSLPPDENELSARLAQVQNMMEKKDLDYYVSFDPVNIYYLTNFANKVHERPFILVVGKQGMPKMLVPFLEAAHVDTKARCELDIITYYEFPAPKGKNWYDYYPGLFDSGSVVGVESAVPVGIFERTPGHRIVADIIDELRLVKSQYEIGRTVHACEVMNLGHEKLLEIARPGGLEEEISREVSSVMMNKVFEDIPDANTVITKATGEVWPPSISHDPHNRPRPSTLMQEGGPHVSIVTGQIDGYGVELERTFFLGKVPDGARKPFQAMYEARALAYELAVPGAVSGEIDKAVRQLLVNRGYGENLLHRTGHGLGITGHEAPYIAEGSECKLAPGMLISIEPGIYIPGLGGFRHSDTLLVTDSGCLNLTEAPETLQELTIDL